MTICIDAHRSRFEVFMVDDYGDEFGETEAFDNLMDARAHARKLRSIYNVDIHDYCKTVD